VTNLVGTLSILIRWYVEEVDKESRVKGVGWFVFALRCAAIALLLRCVASIHVQVYRILLHGDRKKLSQEARRME
jgi:hypothetical protein